MAFVMVGPFAANAREQLNARQKMASNFRMEESYRVMDSSDENAESKLNRMHQFPMISSFQCLS
jgi:cell fate (sporulation/competence/biofilm development) regulator YmcA (YheA/YmcA/DUF963 family)